MNEQISPEKKAAYIDMISSDLEDLSMIWTDAEFDKESTAISILNLMRDLGAIMNNCFVRGDLAQDILAFLGDNSFVDEGISLLYKGNEFLSLLTSLEEKRSEGTYYLPFTGGDLRLHVDEVVEGGRRFKITGNHMEHFDDLMDIFNEVAQKIDPF